MMNNVHYKFLFIGGRKLRKLNATSQIVNIITCNKSSVIHAIK